MGKCWVEDIVNVHAQSHKFDTRICLLFRVESGLLFCYRTRCTTNFPEMPLKLQSSSRSHTHTLYVLHERPTCDVIDDERCSGSSERKIPRALATWKPQVNAIVSDINSPAMLSPLAESVGRMSYLHDIVKTWELTLMPGAYWDRSLARRPVPAN